MEFDYDQLVRLITEAENSVGPASGVIFHSVEAAEAFAYWCIENGIEEPRIVVLEP